ncbi:LexA family transcriptional regulator [Desulfoluna spongiiphila]|uniref:LexA family transcriptional regulator n=1 Tax=Desulfoluna spongiiphila TaxID=419481 RepID=UPI00125AAF71|nr:S24 family peptidase [Desulfoluna spongiiphila]VVS92734.1 bacteriophage ci repressor [Desulfoluna spongiiphila]
MTIEDSIERIKAATGAKTQTELAELLGVPHQSISIAKKKGKVPDKWLINLCVSHKLNPLWVQDGIDPKYIDGKSEGEGAGEPDQKAEQQHPPPCIHQAGRIEEDENGELTVPVLEAPEVDHYYYIPMVEARLSAGGGSFLASERIRDYYAFRKAFIANVTASVKKLILMRVSGESMEPEIRNGATVMIDLGRRHIKNNCIFALGLGDTISVKELEMLPGGRVRVISKNRSAYPPYEADAKDLRIIGQVIWGDRLYPL